jgi:hypothetical protein
MSEWITVPEMLLSAVAKSIDPNPTDRAPHAVTDVPRKLVEALIEYMSEDLACDHSVNICMCEWIGLVDDLKLSLGGKTTCYSCGGDGASWDHAKYEAEMAAARLRGMYADDFAGMIKCPGCGGSGAVSIK